MLKVYNIEIDFLDNTTGLDAISLVESPAVEYNFLKFSKQKPFRFTDYQKHIITGVAILADTPIYRIDPDGYEYYIVFTKDVIKKLVEKYFVQGLSNSVNIEHNSDQFVTGVNLIESYIVDKERGIVPKEFEDVPDGSWIVSYKVENQSVWEKIEKGEVLGFSVEGLFNLIDVKLSKQNMNSIKNKIKNLLLKLSEVESDKGILTWEGDKQLEVGDKVFIDGNPAEDGDYTVDDKVFVIKDGEVAEIRDVMVEELEDDKIIELENRIAEIEDRLSKLEGGKPVEPIVEEFNNQVVKNDKFNKYVKIFKSNK